MTMTLERHGRHAAKNEIPTGDERSVADFVGEYWHALPPRSGGKHDGSDDTYRPTVSEIRERLATPIEAAALDTSTRESRFRPLAVAPPFWDTGTHEGVILKPRRPVGPAAGDDPDATMGFLPFAQVFPTGPDVPTSSPYMPGFTYDKPPLGHSDTSSSKLTTIEPFEPIDTVVKRPPLWKQALIGLKLMKHNGKRL